MKNIMFALIFVIGMLGLNSVAAAPATSTMVIPSENIPATYIWDHYQYAPTYIGSGQVRASWGFTGSGTNNYVVYIGYKVGTDYMLRVCQSGSGSSVYGTCYYNTAPSAISRQWVTVLSVNGVWYWSTTNWIYRQYL